MQSWCLDDNGGFVSLTSNCRRLRNATGIFNNKFIIIEKENYRLQRPEIIQGQEAAPVTLIHREHNSAILFRHILLYYAHATNENIDVIGSEESRPVFNRFEQIEQRLDDND